MKDQIEVFIARVADGHHSFWAGEPESLGFYTQAEIDAGLEKTHGGEGDYSYGYPD